jgi:hypothetical protein
MREWVVLAETDLLDGLTHSMVEYVILKEIYLLLSLISIQSRYGAKDALQQPIISHDQ